MSIGPRSVLRDCGIPGHPSQATFRAHFRGVPSPTTVVLFHPFPAGGRPPSLFYPLDRSFMFFAHRAQSDVVIAKHWYSHSIFHGTLQNIDGTSSKYFSR